MWPKETQFHLAQKELSKLKDQLKNAELTKAQALAELEKAKRTVDELTQKLKSICESKEKAQEATESAKVRAKELEGASNGECAETTSAWKQDLETAREQYMTVINELDAAKQVLRKVHQDYNLSSEVRASAVKQAIEAEGASKANRERAVELSNEIAAVQKSIEQIKLASSRAQQQHAKIFAEKDVLRESYKASLEVSATKLLAMKQEFDPELMKNLEEKLTETLNEIRALQKQMENAKASDLDSVKIVTSELDDAKESLQKILEEESSLKSLVESLKIELENVKKEHSELKEKEAETETTAGNLHVKLQKCKSELEVWRAEESKTRGASEELILTLNQLSSETEIARRDAEDMKHKAAELKKEAEITRYALEEAEKKLKLALEEAEEAKAAEASALEQIKILSERTSAARPSTSESGAKITISKDEFESLSRKVEESDRLAEMKVAAAMAQVEAVKASEHEALKRLEATQKEIEEMKSATQEALRKAEMAEAARRAVEGELRRWREREQKKAAEAASRILAETDTPMLKSPHHYRVHKHNPPSLPSPPPKIEVRKLEKGKSMAPKKVLLPSISGILQRKKNQVQGRSSYLPG